MYRKIPCIRVSGGTFEEATHEVIEEIPLALFLNGRHIMTAVTSPTGYEDFITGYLFCEQIIRGIDEIESIRIEKNRISVLTKNLFKVSGQKKTILSGCGGSTSYIDVEKLPKIRSDFSITPEIIWNLSKEVLNSDLHRTTGGIHVVALADDTGVLAVSEDIGRHNALDRVIGYGLRNGIDFSHTFVLVSGRLSSEMARKCLVANIPILVSRGATTTLAVEIGEKAGLTIVGFSRGSKMNIYSFPERIAGAGKGSPHFTSG
jgi:FdhD protein